MPTKIPTTSKAEIQKKLRASLLLDATRKEKITAVLDVMNPEEQEEMLKILSSEKDDIATMIRNFIHEKGEDGANSIELTIIKIKKNFNTNTEKKSKKEEEQTMENLLKQIEEPNS